MQKDTRPTFIKSGITLVRVDLSELLYVQADGGYVLMYFAGDKKYRVHKTLSAIEEKLPKNFVRVHRSFLVNTEKVNTIEGAGTAGATAYVNRHPVPVSQFFIGSFRNQLQII